MSFFDKIKGYISNKMDSRAYESQKIAEIRKDIQTQAQIEFEQEYRVRALEVAKAKAIRDAQEMSGFKKLQAMNRVVNLNEPSKSTTFSKFSEYTQKNLARREQNLQKTSMLRAVAKEEGLKRQQYRQAFRNNNKSLGKNNLGGFGYGIT